MLIHLMFQVCLSFQIKLIDLVATIPEWRGTSKTDIGRERYGITKFQEVKVPKRASNNGFLRKMGTRHGA